MNNLNSSRSHQLVTIMVESRGHDARPDSPTSSGGDAGASSPDISTKYSTITFVDLAGSEPSAAHLTESPAKRPSTGSTADAQQKREVRPPELTPLRTDRTRT